MVGNGKPVGFVPDMLDQVQAGDILSSRMLVWAPSLKISSSRLASPITGTSSGVMPSPRITSQAELSCPLPPSMMIRLADPPDPGTAGTQLPAWI